MQQRRDQPQVARDRRLAREQAQDPLVDLEVAAVDAVVVLDHHRGQLGVAVDDGLDRLVERLLARSAVESVSLLELVELLVELDRCRGLGVIASMH